MTQKDDRLAERGTVRRRFFHGGPGVRIEGS